MTEQIGNLLVFRYNPAEAKLENGKRCLAWLNELCDILRPLVPTNTVPASEANRILPLLYKLIKHSDAGHTVTFALDLMSHLRWAEGVDYELWAHIYADLLVEWRIDRASRSYERQLQDYLERNWTSFFGPELRLIRREFAINPGRVDFLAEDNKGQVLVECKRDTIDPKALRQLNTYRRDSGIVRGILVGASCRVQLPKGVTFMPHGWVFRDNKDERGGAP